MNLNILLFFCAFNFVYGLKVCKNALDYYLPFSGDCWDNPIDKTNFTEFVKSLGIEAEEHYLTTEDGYTILILRCYGKITKKNPVILGHSTFANGLMFFARMKESLVYTLVSKGYEVWVMNYRGTIFSRTHKKFSQDDREFWDFSYHEIGLYDLRTTVDHVYEHSGKKKSLYVGFSTGGSIFMVYSTIMPQEARKKIMGAILIAPAGKFANKVSQLLLSDPNYNYISRMLFPNYQGAMMYNTTFVNVAKQILPSCHLILSLIDRGIFGWILNRNGKQLNYEALALYIAKGVDIHTEKNAMLFTQNILTGEFRQFDYGEEENLKKYNNSKPPLYAVDRVSVPVAMISSRSDFITPLEGVEELYEMIPDKRKFGFHVVKDEDWTHYDYGIAEDVMEYVNKPVLEYFRTMENSKRTV